MLPMRCVSQLGSELQRMREVQCNAAYRWYLGLKLTDKVPRFGFQVQAVGLDAGYATRKM